MKSTKENLTLAVIQNGSLLFRHKVVNDPVLDALGNGTVYLAFDRVDDPNIEVLNEHMDVVATFTNPLPGTKKKQLSSRLVMGDKIKVGSRTFSHAILNNYTGRTIKIAFDTIHDESIDLLDMELNVLALAVKPTHIHANRAVRGHA
jgi:hypothetical protein